MSGNIYKIKLRNNEYEFVVEGDKEFVEKYFNLLNSNLSPLDNRISKLPNK